VQVIVVRRDAARRRQAIQVLRVGEGLVEELADASGGWPESRVLSPADGDHVPYPFASAGRVLGSRLRWMSWSFPGHDLYDRGQLCELLEWDKARVELDIAQHESRASRRNARSELT
jgi:hypothetical protein